MQTFVFNIALFLLLKISTASAFVLGMVAGGLGSHPIAEGVGSIGFVLTGITLLLFIALPIVAVIQELRGRIFEYPIVKRFIRIDT
jgi:uncharacterized Tic20 family protein